MASPLDPRSGILPRAPDCLVPLTGTQRRYLTENVEQGRFSEMSLWHASVRVHGKLDADLLQRCINQVVQRHESLRTRILIVDGVPRQHIDATIERDGDFLTISGIETQSIAEDFIRQRKDLSSDPPFSAKLLRVSDAEHVLLLTVDHIISDGTSCVILSKEIWTLYNSARSGVSPALPTLPIQFADYAVWREGARREETRHALLKDEAYWRAHLTGAPKLQLPIEVLAGDTDEPMLEIMELPLGEDLSERLRGAARHARTLLPLVVLTVCVAVMSRWCHQRDFVLAFMSHGRHRPELTNIMGFLADYLYLRVQASSKDTFLDLLERVKHEFSCAYQQQHAGSVPDALPGCSAGFEFNWVANNYTRTGNQQADQSGGAIRTEPYLLRLPRRKAVDLSVRRFALTFSETAKGIDMAVLYRSDQFAPGTIKQLCDNLKSLAQHVADQSRACTGVGGILNDMPECEMR